MHIAYILLTKKRERIMKRLIIGLMMFFTMSGVALAEPIVTESTSNSNVTTNTNGKMETTVKSPPPSAISPSISVTNSDLCTVGVAGAVQTQILGISGGSVVRDMNCERLKNAKILYDMGMKVAAVSVMCSDTRVFEAMEMAGTPCPFMGKIGDEAAELWKKNPELRPDNREQEERRNDKLEGAAWGIGGLGLLLLLL
jgi:hypothetical protein